MDEDFEWMPPFADDGPPPDVERVEVVEQVPDLLVRRLLRGGYRTDGAIRAATDEALARDCGLIDDEVALLRAVLGDHDPASPTRAGTSLIYRIGTDPAAYEVAQQGLPTRAVNALLRGGLVTGAQVRAVDDDTLLEIRNMGVGMVEEIRRVFPYEPDAETAQTRPDEGFTAEEAAAVAEVPVTTLGLQQRTVNGLRRARLTTVGQVDALTERDLLRLSGFGRTCLLDWIEKRAWLSTAFAAGGSFTPPPPARDLSRIRDRSLSVSVLGLGDEDREALAAVGVHTVGDLTSFDVEDLTAATSEELMGRLIPIMGRAQLRFRATTRTRAWAEKWALLQDYVAEHGHAAPSRMWERDGVWLGQWVSWMREQHKKGDLDASRAYALEQLPGWYWVREDRERALAVPTATSTLRLLSAYAQREGHSLPPVDHREAGVVLAAAADRVRDVREALPDDLVARFDALPGWTWDQGQAAALVAERVEQTRRERRDGNWMVWYARLREYAEREGDASPVMDYRDEEGNWLGGWVVRQRQRRDAMSADRRRLLEALPGWKWSGIESRTGRQWELSYTVLVDYVAEYGTAEVPLDYVVDGFQLGHWVRRQQTSDPDEFPVEQRERVEALPGWRWREIEARVLSEARRRTLDAHFEERVAMLEEYLAEHGRVPKARYTVDGFRLGHWVLMQRRMYRLGDLAEHRAARLESLPGWVWEVPTGAAAHDPR